MFGSLTKLLAATALAFLATVRAQNYCGGQITNNGNGTLGTFSVQYYGNFTLVTMFGLNNNVNVSEQYVIYCADPAPESTALLALNLAPSTPTFKVPLQSVAVGGTYASSYIELSGHRSAIKVLDTPQNVVSPCLQLMSNNGSITALEPSNLTQYTTVDAGFRQYLNTGQPKDIWIPTSVDVDPLLRIEYIAAVSLFFNDGQYGELMYTKINAAYTGLRADMAQIPVANKKRIGWVYYDFSTNVWRIRNSLFTKGIITAAGGVPFPLSGEVQDNASLSAEEIKTLLLNSQIVIDQTNFSGQTYVTTVQKWMELAGFTSSEQLPVLSQKKVYTLDNTVNPNGSNDYNYRMPSRPDLILKDLIYAQYPSYNSDYSLTFLNGNFDYGQGSTNVLNQTVCGSTSYNDGDIPPVIAKLSFTGDGTTPPALVGSGIYGSDGSTGDQSGGSGGKKTGVVVAVVCVAAVLGAAFAFAFFKWSRRAKEDRFIELEEEMNNEIPLH